MVQIIIKYFKSLTCSKVRRILSWQDLIWSTSRMSEFSGWSLTRSIPLRPSLKNELPNILFLLLFYNNITYDRCTQRSRALVLRFRRVPSPNSSSSPWDDVFHSSFSPVLPEKKFKCTFTFALPWRVSIPFLMFALSTFKTFDMFLPEAPTSRRLCHANVRRCVGQHRAE